LSTAGGHKVIFDFIFTMQRNNTNQIPHNYIKKYYQNYLHLLFTHENRFPQIYKITSGINQIIKMNEFLKG
jgi:hypothetical protein